MGLTLQGLSENECRRWIRSFREQDDSEAGEPGKFEIEVELLHSDFSSIGTKSGSKRFPDSLNIVKFDGSILRTETDVVVAPGNSFVVCTEPGAQLRVRSNKKPELGLRDLIRVSGGGKSKEVEISMKLATNITSKAHCGRHFVFRVNAREMSPENQETISFWGVTEPFELFAKPTASETSHESLRRQASAHSLASLASLASLGLQACESEEVHKTNCATNHTNGAPSSSHLEAAAGENPVEEEPPSKRLKGVASEFTRQESASGPDIVSLAHVVMAHASLQEPEANAAAEHWQAPPPVDYLAALRPNNAAAN